MRLIDVDETIDALELTTWYHQSENGEMVKGANSQEHQAWYKAEDVYKVLNDLLSVQPEIIRCKDCKYRDENWRRVTVKWLPCMDMQIGDNWYCGSAEKG